MITRVFQATVPAELHAEFEEKFKEVSVPLVSARPGVESAAHPRRHGAPDVACSVAHC